MAPQWPRTPEEFIALEKLCINLLIGRDVPQTALIPETVDLDGRPRSLTATQLLNKTKQEWASPPPKTPAKKLRLSDMHPYFSLLLEKAAKILAGSMSIIDLRNQCLSSLGMESDTRPPFFPQPSLPVSTRTDETSFRFNQGSSQDGAQEGSNAVGSQRPTPSLPARLPKFEQLEDPPNLLKRKLEDSDDDDRAKKIPKLPGRGPIPHEVPRKTAGKVRNLSSQGNLGAQVHASPSIVSHPLVSKSGSAFPLQDFTPSKFMANAKGNPVPTHASSSSPGPSIAGGTRMKVFSVPLPSVTTPSKPTSLSPASTYPLPSSSHARLPHSSGASGYSNHSASESMAGNPIENNVVFGLNEKVAGTSSVDISDLFNEAWWSAAEGASSTLAEPNRAESATFPSCHLSGDLNPPPPLVATGGESCFNLLGGDVGTRDGALEIPKPDCAFDFEAYFDLEAFGLAGPTAHGLAESSSLTELFAGDEEAGRQTWTAGATGKS